MKPLLDILDTDNAHRAKNYLFGAGAMSISLADLTGYLQFIAAAAGAVLVCRQLWRDVKRKNKDGNKKP